ncbi:MAG: zinc ribbon domain-containing protein [Chloroflexi bacterium]|nr:zinc ribbon domain-containing protein [Chloroflexota bacterium]
MVTIVIALVIIASVAAVAYPFFVPSRADDIAFAFAGDPGWENLVVQRDAAYSAIKDLELDHTMGKLSDADYKSLRAKYESKAVAILQELDSYRASKGARANGDDSIERQVQQMRGDAAKRARCPKCGTRAQPRDRFCAKCGTAIKA